VPPSCWAPPTACPTTNWPGIWPPAAPRSFSGADGTNRVV
jgi:hypothetical protein